LSEDQLASFVNVVKDSRNEKKVSEMAKLWVSENRELVDAWLGKKLANLSEIAL